MAISGTHEHEAGRQEGQKDRPSVIVLAVESNAKREADDATIVTVLPITHSPPNRSSLRSSSTRAMNFFGPAMISKKIPRTDRYN
jgi:hypothetical protein